jgi:hypothetical protein
MARAGHSDFKTTQVYIDLAGVMFREEAERLERRLWGSDQYQIPVPNRVPVAGTANGPVAEPWKKPQMCRQFQGTERRRSRTYPPTGYAGSPVLKVCQVSLNEAASELCAPGCAPVR